MTRKKIAIALLLAGIVSAFLPAIGRAAITGHGTDFWLAWPKSHAGNEQSAEIILLADQPASYQISGAMTGSGTVDATFPRRITIPFTAKVVSSSVADNRGIHVVSTDGITPISVLLRVPVQAEASDDIAALLPTGELGTEYRVVSYNAFLNGEPSEFVVVATQDATNVQISDVPCGANGNFSLNAGEIVQIQCAKPEDVTGSRVLASRPVAVLAAHSEAYVPSNVLYGDYMVEAMWPVSEWGTEFYVAPTPKGANASDRTDLYRLMSAADGSADIEGPSGTQVIPLTAAPQFYEFTSPDPLHITTTAPAFLMQFHQGSEISDIGDPFMMDVPSAGQWQTAFRAYLPPDYSQGTFATLVASQGVYPTVTLDGASITGWAPFVGGGYSYVVMPLGSLTGEHVFSGAGLFSVLIHGYNDVYLSNPGLGKAPGAYGYPATKSQPTCVILVDAGGNRTACDGAPMTVTSVSTTPTGCALADVEYLWERDGAPLTGWLPSPSYNTTVVGGTYALRARCKTNPSCIGVDSFVLTASVNPVLPINPNPAQVCEGEPITLTADPGYQNYSWTTDPPGADGDGAMGQQITVRPVTNPTQYYVNADDPGTGCRPSGKLTVDVLPDPVPGVVDYSLRLTRPMGSDDIVFRWSDLPGGTAVAQGYAVPGYDCPTRATCALKPSPAVMNTAPVSAPVAPTGQQRAVQTNGAQYPPDLTFYKVVALSPCSGSKRGPTCNESCSNPLYCYAGCP